MKPNIWLTSAVACLFLVARPSAAALGEDLNSVQVDRTQLQAELQITGGERFAVHHLRLPSGTAIQEYVSSAGMVFAVSWQGPSMPDLQQLLGRYFEAYVEALKQQNASAAPALQQPGLVVQTGGHMRAYFGRVYVPAMLPRGVSAADIQ